MSYVDGRKLHQNAADLQQHRKANGEDNPGLSSTTVHSVHLTLRCAFERAVKERLINRNPTDDCIAPKVQKVEMKTLLQHTKQFQSVSITSAISAVR